MLNVNAIENDLYAKVCDGFAEYAEKRLIKYQSVLDFLRATDLKAIVNLTTGQVYELYVGFCESRGYEKLEHTVFSRTICECGFQTHHLIKTVNGKRKKNIYFTMW
ncbi:hypothetical protein HYG86_11395 [Alkalicella caledoniensis]|uniref:DNA primase/nucleoside triphosphatase C-terminal domain-containing protein n=1 Tax=Alkalicella caledoniensis TaxID=2731377 RepID=A0A7G9W9G5_ALKCA|nr:hypothetical protein [Alkalicella caledoniensis]QNO15327.1 hypothetical protein HYG86_11395 [Alkalicella caledoniensis]